jgi:anti-anti-sigma factor
MKLSRQNGTLSVTGLRELNSTNAPSFQAAVSAALTNDLQMIEIDLSQTQTLDGAGLGALVSLFETANQHRAGESVALRLANPSPTVLQMIELARLHHLFEITPPQVQPLN